MLNLVFGGHFVFAKKMRMVIMDYHAKSGASSMKIVILMVLGDADMGGNPKNMGSGWESELPRWQSGSEGSVATRGMKIDQVMVDCTALP